MGLTRLRAAVVAAVVLFAPAAQAAQLELTPDRLCAVWDNINEVLLKIGAAEAMDDDWLNALNAMKPEAAMGVSEADMVKAISAFQERLKALFANADKPPRLPGAAEPDVVGLYGTSGRVLDALVLHVVAADPIALVGIYYLPPEPGRRTMKDAAALVDLAGRRLDSIIEEFGL